MSESGSTIDMFTDMKPLGGGDIEAGSSDGHVNDIERNDIASTIEVPLCNMANVGNESEHVSDIDKWAASLTRILEDVPQYMYGPGHPGRISRIPENLREVDRKAYEPYFLAIGPYHHMKQSVQKMEKRKRLVLKCILEQNPELTLIDYMREITSLEPAARRFYSDIEMESKEFVEMLLLDSLYLVTGFCGLATSQTPPRGGSRVDNEETNEWNEVMGTEDEEADESNTQRKSGERWFQTFFTRDLFLLENQIPFFVLQRIYALTHGCPETQLLGIVKEKIGILLVNYTKRDFDLVISPTEGVHHLLHLCHMFFRPTAQQMSTTFRSSESNQMFRLGSAMQLYEAGVTFEAISSSTQHSLLDITLDSSGKMVMLCLQVDDITVSLLRNLIALEQMKYPSLGLHLSAYAVLLLHLVTVPEDVKLLRKKGIIEHHLASDKEMMYLVNRLSVGLAFDYMEDEYNLKPVFYELKRYTEHRLPRWRAWLKHRYFSNPWTVISLMAASLLLLLSTLQTYYTVYSYYHPIYPGNY